MEVVKVFNRDGESYRRLEQDICSYRNFTLDWYKVCWPWMAIYNSFLPCIALITLPVGSWFVLQGYSTLPDLILVLCMSFGVGAPLKQNDQEFHGKDHSVTFENVRFSYEQGEVLHGISMTAKQEQFLFHISLKENIRLGKPDASDEEVLEAARKAQCMEFLEKLENGIDTLAGDGGKQLSGGERQRISLARAILKNAPVGFAFIGKISSVLSTDMVFVEENCMTALADMMSEIFSEAILLAFLFVLDIRIGIAGIATLIVILIIAKGMRREALEDSDRRQEQSERLTEAVLDFAEGIGIIKTYNLLGEKSKELTENFKRSCETNLHFENAHGPWQRALNLAYGIGTGVILSVAVYLQIKGTLSISYFIGLMLFLFHLFGPLKALYGGSTRLTVMNSCMDRIEDVFAQPELSDDGTEKIPEKYKGAEIEFQNVCFGYGEKEILHDISFQLPKNHISMVFQRVYLFQDTIYHNISMGRPDATKEEVIEAAKKARCILKDAPIVILDEATASVDADNERYIQEAINELCVGKTLIVIAHRLNTIQGANEILVIRDGKIEDRGNHEELIAHGGTYQKFVQGRQKCFQVQYSNE